ncbi:MAG: NAD(P)-binding domain-containing protein, partial [Pseudomonadota bacterium]|nr:NAD(P)-binding domain-containing protein [Pseudomonadota bacterium]
MRKSPIGFIGLGDMGGPMVLRLLDAGYELAIYDTRDEAMTTAAEKGAHRATDPADVANRCKTVFVSLPTPNAVRDVALGPNGLAEGTAIHNYIDLSTTGAVMA